MKRSILLAFFFSGFPWEFQAFPDFNSQFVNTAWFRNSISCILFQLEEPGTSTISVFSKEAFSSIRPRCDWIWIFLEALSVSAWEDRATNLCVVNSHQWNWAQRRCHQYTYINVQNWAKIRPLRDTTSDRCPLWNNSINHFSLLSFAQSIRKPLVCFAANT